ncbi:2,3-bisphosphoglycerate-independent phosphoglycerate mutase [Sneathiella chinensis]|uniref:2,3-bisphosphoglycerate-independent phosphoglycerate mutase n=1 Tax=Sneathiella chinensis TaxID=349750 RepID=A0ABQ5U7V6_9PROT|nr:2,3-bisphosphoglycerate-independent phosphoglycerate mutase [Sneathiella chinensis]GLQ07876.1 2,3-bisphosphoglycerate-independent phosphoglycerate mutase [Sneathiella chinensis]
MSTQTPVQEKRPVLLCILDGWGHRTDAADNAILRGNTPNWDRMVATRPMSLLGTSGEDVGLPEGQMGNSEVGHMTIGSGRVILQDLPRINRAIHTGELAKNAELNTLIDTLKKTGGACHIAGLLSPGGVHSHQDHMVALARIVADAGIRVYLHGFMDGRDTPPTSGADYVKEVAEALAAIPGASIATLCGRYFAMDRDMNWDRVILSYNAMFHGTGAAVTDPVAAIQDAYDHEETDEFLKPRILDGFAGMQDGDAFLMANFRADRARQMLNAITDEPFDGFDRGTMPKLATIVGMVEYSAALAPIVPALFPPVEVKNTLGQVTAMAGRKQLRIAETEKYAHVTFFLNGGEETVFDGEERILVPSPKVATYDLKPEMSAPEVLEKLLDAIRSDRFDLIVVNFANPDMVGHTGVMEAAIKAVETIDTCIGQLSEAVTAANGVMLVTADHGNIELMKDQTTHKPHTAHTTNLVPFVLAAGDSDLSLENGTLADVAPTVLGFMGLPVPEDMTGRNLASPGDTDRTRRAVS